MSQPDLQENEIEPKVVVPVVAGNTRVLLSVPEWAFSLIIFVIYFSFTGKFFWFFLIAQIIITLIYILFLSKLEENIMNVLIQSAKMPDIVCGSFIKPIPYGQKEETTNVLSE